MIQSVNDRTPPDAPCPPLHALPCPLASSPPCIAGRARGEILGCGRSSRHFCRQVYLDSLCTSEIPGTARERGPGGHGILGGHGPAVWVQAARVAAGAVTARAAGAAGGVSGHGGTDMSRNCKQASQQACIGKAG